MAQRILEIITRGNNTYGHLDGFLYTVSDYSGDIKYWKCRRKNTCNARLVTVSTGRTLLIRKGESPSDHKSHAPDPKEVKALHIMSSIRKEASKNPERPPFAVMRIVQTADPAVQAQLPQIDSIRKTIQRERQKNLLPNPKTIQDLQKLPEKFRKTLVGDIFLIYDSYEDEDYDLNYGRILIFSTQHYVSNRSQAFFPTFFNNGNSYTKI